MKRVEGLSESAPGRLLLGFACLGLLAAALVPDPRLARGLCGAEITTWLAAASIAHDGDLRLQRRDLERYERTWNRPAEQVEVRAGEDRSTVLAVPPLYALALAPAVRLAPARGAFALQAILFVLAAWGAAWRLSGRLGPDAWLWVAMAAFASVAFASSLRLTPTALGVVAAVAAFALAEPRRLRQPEEEQPQIYGEPMETLSAGGSLPRHLAAGALLGIAASLHPAYLLLVLPLLLTLPRRTRWRRLAALLGGLALPLLLAAALAGPQAPHPWIWHADRYGHTTGLPSDDEARPQERLSTVRGMAASERFHPGLMGWNLVYGVAGRHLGLLPYALPLMLALAGWGRGTRRWPWAAAALLGWVALALADPFRLAGGSAEVGPGLYLPFVGALWFLPTRLPHRGLIAAVAVAAAAFLFPLWRAPQAYPVTDAGEARHAGWAARRWLPWESTQQEVVGAGSFVELAGVRVRPVGGSVWDDPARRGFRLLGRQGGELWIAGARPLTAAVVSFGTDAPTDLEVRGGTVVSTLFRPDGGVDFRVELEPAARRHPMWWGGGVSRLYRLHLRFPDAAERPLRFGLAVEQDEAGGA